MKMNLEKAGTMKIGEFVVLKIESKRCFVWKGDADVW